MQPLPPPNLDRYAPIYIPAWIRAANAIPPNHYFRISIPESKLINFPALHESLFPKRLLSEHQQQEHQHFMWLKSELEHVPPVLEDHVAPIGLPGAPPNLFSGPSGGPALPTANVHAPGSSNSTAYSPGMPRTLPPGPGPPPTLPGASRPPPPLLPHLYGHHWLPIIETERQARSRQLFTANLYAVPITPLSLDPVAAAQLTPSNMHTSPALYTLETRSIREGWPPVDLGDIVELRQLQPHTQTWQGILFEASVWGINRAAGQVVIRCDMLRQFEETLIFNVHWRVQDRVFNNWRSGIMSLSMYLRRFGDPADHSKGLAASKALTKAVPIMRPDGGVVDPVADKGPRRTKSSVECWLFPHESDIDRTEPPPVALRQGQNPFDQLAPIDPERLSRLLDSINSGKGTAPRDKSDNKSAPPAKTRAVIAPNWVDSTLNEEQKHAVTSILTRHHRIPYLISGPPGTGKTKTLVEAVLQILKTHPDTHILLCGASNSSADTLCLRLNQLSPALVFRLNAPSRPLNEVRTGVMQFCHIVDDTFNIPELTVLLRKRVIVTTCVDAALLVQASCTNHYLSSLEHLMTNTFRPQRTVDASARAPFHEVITQRTVEPHFGYLIVDEAAQASEPDVASALAVVASDDALCSPRAHVTLCGDSHQLGPDIVSHRARSENLDTSLLERLFDLPVYKDHSLSRENARRTDQVRLSVDTPFCNLTKNYRSAVPILMLPSLLFYNDTLEPYAPATTQETPLAQWSGLPRKGFPVLFHGIFGVDEPIDEGASYYNEEEVNLVKKLVVDLIAEGSRPGSATGPLRPEQISVISPFREQVWRVRLGLRDLRLGGVDVGNVEALQGAENRVVIISTVRSRPRWLQEDKERSRGLIFEPKRFNVAMTRAQEMLIVIGNPDILCTDPYWRSFYHFCVRNGCYTGVTPGSVASGDQFGMGTDDLVSRLENTYNVTHTNPVSRRTRAKPNGQSHHNSTGSVDEGDHDLEMLIGSMARQTLAD